MHIYQFCIKLFIFTIAIKPFMQMFRVQSSSYKFEFFIMDVTIPEHYEATHCYISLVSDQFQQILTRKSKVVNCVSEIEATLKPKMTLCLSGNSNQYRPPFVKLQVYISSHNNPNSHLVIGSLTFDLLEELVNPNQKEIRQHFVGTDIRIRLSINSNPCQDFQFNQTKLLSTQNSILKQIQNIDQQPEQFCNFLKEKVPVRHVVNPAINFMESECLDFSDIMPNNLSKLNDSTSFQCNKNKDLYYELVKLNEEVLRLKEQNKDLQAENEELKAVNEDLEDVNSGLSKELKEADEKIVRLQKQYSIFQQKLNTVDIMKMQIVSKSEQQKKNSEEIEKRNLQIMKFVNELQQNELRLNYTITQKEQQIEELKSRVNESNSSVNQSVTELNISLNSFNKTLKQWKNGQQSIQQKDIQGLIKTLKNKENNRDQAGRSFITRQLQKAKIQLTQLKKQYLFKSEISIINLITYKIEALLAII